MNIRKILRERFLNEGKHKNNSFGCLMVYFDYDKKDWDNLQNNIEEDDLYKPKNDVGYGRETNPHTTILYGLHSDITDEEIKDNVDDIKSPKIKLGKISSFTNDDFDVLKYEVISADMYKLNKELSELPNTNTFPKYEPHCTIAYINKGIAKKYIDKLNKLDKVNVTPKEIIYSKADDSEIKYKFKDN